MVNLVWIKAKDGMDPSMKKKAYAFLDGSMPSLALIHTRLTMSYSFVRRARTAEAAASGSRPTR